MNMLLPYVDKMVSAYLDVSPQSPEVATTVARYEVTRGFRRFSGRCLSTKVPTRHFFFFVARGCSAHRGLFTPRGERCIPAP